MNQSFWDHNLSSMKGERIFRSPFLHTMKGTSYQHLAFHCSQMKYQSQGLRTQMICGLVFQVLWMVICFIGKKSSSYQVRLVLFLSVSVSHFQLISIQIICFMHWQWCILLSLVNMCYLCYHCLHWLYMAPTKDS